MRLCVKLRGWSVAVLGAPASVGRGVRSAEGLTWDRRLPMGNTDRGIMRSKKLLSGHVVNATEPPTKGRRRLRTKDDSEEQSLAGARSEGLGHAVRSRAKRKAQPSVSTTAASKVSDEESLALAHSELESRVVQRTAELAADNERLREEIGRREQVEESLRRSEEQLRTGFDAGPMGIAVVRLDGTITRVNRRLCDILKYSSADLLGKQFSDFTDSGDKDVDAEMLGHVVRGRLPSYTTERRVVCGKGEPIWVRSTSALVCDAQGRPSYLLAMCEDITPQKQAEEAVRRSERLASVGTLASGIAHEINNPIGAALLAAEAAMVLKDRPEKREQFEQSLNTVMRSVERCADIVRRVLVFSRGSSAQKRSTKVQEVIDQAHHLTASMATAKHVTLMVNGDEELPELVLSPIEMQLALINLINNAVEASAPGGRVAVQATKAANTVRIDIEDHGRGMTKTETSRLFDPFYSTRHQEGAVGLGLSTSLGIVQQHGGRIEVKSSSGKGTTMTIVLPIDYSPTDVRALND